MKKFYLAIIITTIFINQNIFADKKFTKEEFQSATFLSKVASKMNVNMPQFVDENTRIDNIQGFKKLLRFNYTLVHFKKSTSKNIQIELDKNLKPLVKNSVCSTPRYSIFPQNGVYLTYVYSDMNGMYIGEFTIKPSDCGYSNN